MRSFGIVHAEPRRHGCGSPGRSLIWGGVYPLAQRRLNEAFCLAIGARRSGPGPLVSDASQRERSLEEAARVGRLIVGHDALDRYTMAVEEAECVVEEGVGALLLLVGQNFGVGQPGGVVDGNV